MGDDVDKTQGNGIFKMSGAYLVIVSLSAATIQFSVTVLLLLAILTTWASKKNS